MGFPYSKQIDLAFEQIGPFLQRARYITFLLGAFHALTILVLCLLLGLILLALVGLLITVNPDLEAERRAVVTPVLRRLVRWTAAGVPALADRSGPSPGVRADPAGQRRWGRLDRSEKSK
ncbi:hypothetical protein NKR19_g5357 [Coniochaeta hoffmannii]|uniref:Uncharacterized protein n=1 Tax=Coniochaeta hoffmannii TaxID=91930 RepID=A0AA38RI14_9PEZI|nr:hypothetical protein NKR19_g5357 [Coniochaeta hoffmannii]